MTYHPEINRALNAAENEGWPSQQSPRREPANQTITHDTNLAERLARHGITRVAVDYFNYRNYRYTNAMDAIAQAQREQGSQGSAASVPEATARSIRDA